MSRRVVIIADSLTNDFMGRNERYLQSRVHLGVSETARLFGEGDAWGSGPLPVFLRAAAAAVNQGKPVHLVFLRDWHDPANPDQKAEMARFGAHNLQNTPGADFIDGIEDALACGQILNTGSLSLPVFPFLDLLEQYTGFSPRKMTDAVKNDLVFVLVGAHTDIRVYHTAFTLRHDYQFPQVLVCPHLVGSPNRIGHEQYLQANYSDALVQVVAGLPELYELIGLQPTTPIAERYLGCRFTPDPLYSGLKPDYQQILKRLFLFQSEAGLTPLGGGYSGSLLVIASGLDQHGARLAPVIVKIDRHDKIQREIEGYHRVRQLVGNHVPHFHTPVSHGEATGILMEVAVMSGKPQTLQSCFEKAVDQGSAARFLRLLRAALGGLIELVIANRRRLRRVYPWRELGLHTRQQKKWLAENLSQVIPAFSISASKLQLDGNIEIDNPFPLYVELATHADRLQVPVSLCHGDLNLANLITDDSDNWWIIDWSYASEGPIERDLAKLENDLKFVLMKQIDTADYPRLLAFETFLCRHSTLPPIADLPAHLQWLMTEPRWHLLYESLREVREAVSAAAGPERVSEMYDLFLVKFAAHTLSFDSRRINPQTGQPRGECTVPMMTWAAISLSLLLSKLKRSPWHARVLRDRYPGYPERFPVPIEKRAWQADFPEYQPPYYVAPEVLANDGLRKQGGWADPDDVRLVPDLQRRVSLAGNLTLDTEGRPRNPLGRTGLSGRGFWGRWGPNAAVDPVITRLQPRSRELEILLIKRGSADQWALPGGIIRNGDSVSMAAARSLLEKTSLQIDPTRFLSVGEQVVEDFRNTDHAWVESQVVFAHLNDSDHFEVRSPHAADIVDVDWCPLSPEFTRRLFANHLTLISRTLERSDVRHLLPREAAAQLDELLMTL